MPRRLQECAGDQKKFFQIIKSIIKQLQQEQYPDSDSLKDLLDALGDFFSMKIQKTWTELDCQAPGPSGLDASLSSMTMLS